MCVCVYSLCVSHVVLLSSWISNVSRAELFREPASRELHDSTDVRVRGGEVGPYSCISGKGYLMLHLFSAPPF